MKKSLVLLPVFLMSLSGCQTNSKPNFSCEDEAIVNEVTSQIYEGINKLGEMMPGIYEDKARIAATYKHGVTFLSGNDHSDLYEIEKDYENLNFSLRNIRTVEQNEEIGNYSCKSSLVATKGDREAEVELNYTAEATNNGEDSYVEVSQLSEEDIIVLSSVFIKYK